MIGMLLSMQRLNAVASATLRPFSSTSRWEISWNIAADGSSFGSATALGTARKAAGLVERRTDVDVFSFRRSCSGPTTISATPFTNSPDLDIRLRLHNAGHATLATGNPVSGQASYDVATGLDATVTKSLPAGTYFLQVDGVGALTPTTGYSDYGSLGRFTVQISPCA